MGRPMRRVGPSYVCDFCEAVFPWNDKAGWFGSYHDLETRGEVEWVWCGECNGGKRPKALPAKGTRT